MEYLGAIWKYKAFLLSLLPPQKMELLFGVDLYVCHCVFLDIYGLHNLRMPRGINKGQGQF